MQLLVVAHIAANTHNCPHGPQICFIGPDDARRGPWALSLHFDHQVDYFFFFFNMFVTKVSSSFSLPPSLEGVEVIQQVIAVRLTNILKKNTNG